MAGNVNPDKLLEFLGKAIVDIGAAMSANLLLIRDKLTQTMEVRMYVTATSNSTKTLWRSDREWKAPCTPITVT